MCSDCLYERFLSREILQMSDLPQSLLSGNPKLRVERSFSLAHLELQSGIAGIVGSNGAQNLVRGDFLSLLDFHLREVAVHGKVFAVRDNNIIHAAQVKDCCDFACENAACACSSLASKVDALVVQTYIF